MIGLEQFGVKGIKEKFFRVNIYILRLQPFAYS